MRPPLPAALPLMLWILGCEGTPVDTAGTGELPAETGEYTYVYDTSTYSVETGGLFDTANALPDTLLTLEQTGTWNLSPPGGPWTTVMGDLHVIEYLEDGAAACDVSFNVEGTVTDEACEGCTTGLTVRFNIAAGNPSPCRDTDLPEPDETRELGWAPDEQTLYWNYYNSGAWLPWYDVTLDGDTLHVSWQAQLGLEG